MKKVEPPQRSEEERPSQQTSPWQAHTRTESTKGELSSLTLARLQGCGRCLRPPEHCAIGEVYPEAAGPGPQHRVEGEEEVVL